MLDGLRSTATLKTSGSKSDITHGSAPMPQEQKKQNPSTPPSPEQRRNQSAQTRSEEAQREAAEQDRQQAARLERQSTRAYGKN